MDKIWICVCFVLVLALVQVRGDGDSENESKLLSKSFCQLKFNLTNEQVENVRRGVIGEDRNVKCYTACVLRNLGVVRRRHISAEKALKVIELLAPVGARPELSKAVDNCKDSIKHIDDLCEASYVGLKCVISAVPKLFNFP